MHRLLNIGLTIVVIFISINYKGVKCDEQVQNLVEAATDILIKLTGNGTDENLEEWVAPEEMRKHLVYYHSGYDDEDRPIWIAEWGKWDVKKYVEGGEESLQLYDKYADQMMLRMLKSVERRRTPENPVSSVIFIIDVEDYPIEQLVSTGALVYNLRKFGSWTSLLEGISKGFIINTNFLAERVLNLVKPILGSHFERFEVYGTNKAKWIPKLLKEVPRSQIPEWYGGSKDFTPVQVFG